MEGETEGDARGAAERHDPACYLLDILTQIDDAAARILLLGVVKIMDTDGDSKRRRITCVCKIYHSPASFSRRLNFNRIQYTTCCEWVVSNPRAVKSQSFCKNRTAWRGAASASLTLNVGLPLTF